MSNKTLKILSTISGILLFIFGIYYTAVYGILAVIEFIFVGTVSKFFIFAVLLFILLVLDILVILRLYDKF